MYRESGVVDKISILRVKKSEGGTMRRYGMVISPVSLTAGGIILAFTGIQPWSTILAVTCFCWIILEFHIARKQEYLSQVPPARWIMISRMLWLGSVVFTVIDAGSGNVCIAADNTVRISASIVVSAALLLRWKAFHDLGRAFTYDVRTDSSEGFVSAGIYHFIRHPAYLAICFLGTLPALIAGSTAGFVLLTVFTVPQTLYRLEVEEKMLRNEHGAEFEKYCDSTWKMIPWIY